MSSASRISALVLIPLLLCLAGCHSGPPMIRDGFISVAKRIPPGPDMRPLSAELEGPVVNVCFRAQRPLQECLSRLMLCVIGRWPRLTIKKPGYDLDPELGKRLVRDVILEDVSLREALDALTETTRTRWAIRDGQVWVVDAS